MSLTASGLQEMIKVSNNYVLENGLSFNSAKTKCSIFGKSFLDPLPKWKLNGCELQVCNEIDYLGAILSNSQKYHIDKRMKACRQAFYGLQSAGLTTTEVKPSTAAYMWKVALQPVLLYACQSVPVTKSQIAEMDKLQAKLIKTSLGLSKYLRTTPLVNALKIHNVPLLINVLKMNLVKSMIFNTSAAKDFYLRMLNQPTKCSFMSDVKSICNDFNISAIKFLFDDQYSMDCKQQMKKFPEDDGLIDSLRILLKNYSEVDKDMVRMLLSAF